MKKTVTKRFFITTTSEGQIFAEVGDTLTLADKGAEFMYIKKLNDRPIFSIWQRKNWILAHCK